ncbi:universal stress protein [Thermobifida cellulosilytica]|uniref:Stress-inducible protein n=1 Tax=Thermobifida cellulosilytica TB100 TaxID=665004 RepID=A0A147KDK7_THECS|nr:universal stress protein [Thermobifida cellulosilytica]KUP95348.1 stress-inducible protein [Thermobifida cellulosilytica TB100]
MERTVLVGVDGSAEALEAVAWAAREAHRRQYRLALVSAYVMPPAEAAFGWPPDAIREDARAVVRAARDRALETAPGLEVTDSVIVDSPVSALLRQAREAAMLVVGLRGRGGFPGLRIGSVAYRAAAHAPVPTVVVPGPVPEEDTEVVVGVSGTRRSDHVLAEAFEAATLGGKRLRAVRAWAEPILPSPGMRPLLYEPEAVEAVQARELAEALQPWEERYPDVTVVRDVVEAPPVVALGEAGATARLVVVGARSSRGITRLALGRVAHGLLHTATRPVMVVPVR